MRMVQRELPVVEKQKESLREESGPPYGWAALSCAAVVVGLTILALTRQELWLWGLAVGLIAPVQMGGLLLAWQAIRGAGRGRWIGWAAVAMNLLAIGVGALVVGR